MFEFAFIWAFILLPLPFIVRMLIPATNEQPKAALHMPALRYSPNQAVSMNNASQRSLFIPALIWLLLITAAARPQWLGEPIALPSEGRDLMLAVDLSGSMDIEDMVLNGSQVNRLTMLKNVLGDFISRRVGDRLGLILFADTAYLQTPLTYDRETVRTMLQEAVIGLVGEKTAIGDAVGLATKRFADKEETNKVLILLTDGQNTAGNLTPEEALTLAEEHDITIYTIGVGADEMQVRSFFGNRSVNPSAELDENLLTELASKTGGQYFRAKDTAGLAQIYQQLDELEPIAKDTIQMRPLTALFYWPLATALLLSVLMALSALFNNVIMKRSKSPDKTASIQGAN
ncbi:vWA domain-containing protein [Flocculibacter collagenilyticus]|uniref:vWA domain-containing protein n=1 Tax=Flocculibacter collagenilyticus TaxID=2744479 RepID=UPI0018F456C3|nr:VWA domain-containing protein [Flocculibacter collagenilyticus]